MEERRRQDEVEIDLKEIMSLIVQHAAVIILAALCVAIFLYTDGKMKASKVYISTTKMYILSRNNDVNTVSSNSNLTTSVLKDYQSLATSKSILEEVNQKLELGRSYEALASQITVSIPTQDKIMQISVKDKNPIISMKIANTLREVTSQYLKSTMDISLFDVIEEAMVGTPQTTDKAKRNAVLGAVIVACFIIGVLVTKYLIDDSIKTPEEIETKLGLCVLASIPINERQMTGSKKRAVWGKKHKIKESRKKNRKNTNTQVEYLEKEGANL